MLLFSWGAITSFVITAFVSYIDIEHTFNYPSDVRPKPGYIFSIFIFLVLNGVLSLLMLNLVHGTLSQKIPSEILQGLIVGISYQAFIRIKLFTFEVNGVKIPFGLEYFYDKVKEFFYRRINKIIRKIKKEEVEKLVTTKSLDQLSTDLNSMLAADDLVNPEDTKKIFEYFSSQRKKYNSTDDENEKDFIKKVFATKLVDGNIEGIISIN